MRRTRLCPAAIQHTQPGAGILGGTADGDPGIAVTGDDSVPRWRERGHRPITAGSASVYADSSCFQIGIHLPTDVFLDLDTLIYIGEISKLETLG